MPYRRISFRFSLSLGFYFRRHRIIQVVPSSKYFWEKLTSLKRRWRPGRVWAVIVIIASAGTAAFLVHRAWWDSDDIPVLQEAISSGKGFDGVDEYDPVKDDHTDLPVKAPAVQVLPRKGTSMAEPGVKIRIVHWTAEQKDLTVTSLGPLRLAVRLLDYPAWRVEVNGLRVTPDSPDTTAQIIVPVPA